MMPPYMASGNMPSCKLSSFLKLPGVSRLLHQLAGTCQTFTAVLQAESLCLQGLHFFGTGHICCLQDH